MRTLAQIRAEASAQREAEAAITNPPKPAIDLSGIFSGASTVSSNVGEVAQEAYRDPRGFVGSLATGANVLGTAAGVGTFAATGNPVASAAASSVGGAIGSIYDDYGTDISYSDRFGRAALTASQFAIFDGILSASRALRLAAKSKLLRHAKPGQLPKGGIVGRAMDDADEAFSMGREMAYDLKAMIDSGRYTSRLTPAELDRHLQGSLTAPQLTHGEFFDQLAGRFEGSTAGQPIRRLQESTKRLWEDWADMYKKNIGVIVDDPQQLTAMAKTEIDRFVKLGDDANSALHQRVMGAVGSDSFTLAEIQGAFSGAGGIDSVESIIHGWKRIASQTPDPEKIGRIVGNAEGIIKTARARARQAQKIANAAAAGKPLKGNAGVPPVQLTVEEARRIRTLYREARQATPAGTAATAQADSIKVENALKKLIEDHLTNVDNLAGTTGTPQSLSTTWSKANKQSLKSAKDKVRMRVTKLTELIDERKLGPEALDTLVPDSMSPINIRLLRENMGGASAPVWKSIQAFKAEQLMQDLIVKGGKADFNGLLARLTDIRSRAHMRELLGTSGYDSLRRYAVFGREATRASPVAASTRLQVQENGWMRIAAITAAGAAGGVGAAKALGGSQSETGAAAALGVAATGLAIFIAPRQVAKWLVSPGTAEYVLTGMNPKSTPKQVAAAVARLTTMAMAEADKTVGTPLHELATGTPDIIAVDPKMRPEEARLFSAWTRGAGKENRGRQAQ